MDYLPTMLHSTYRVSLVPDTSTYIESREYICYLIKERTGWHERAYLAIAIAIGQLIDESHESIYVYRMRFWNLML